MAHKGTERTKKMATKPTGRPTGRPTTPKKLAAEEQVSEAPPAPKHLAANGRELWETVWREGKEWLKAADYALIENLCEVFEEKEYLRAQIAIENTPRFYRLSNGALTTHPIVTQLKDARTQMNTLLSSIGFTPTERARMDIEKDVVGEMLKTLQANRQAKRAERSRKRGDEA